MARTRRSRGFSLVELLVALVILVVLLSIFVPYLLSIRESNRRVMCASNLNQLRDALTKYREAHGIFPRVVYDEVDWPSAYFAFTGATSPSPFGEDSTVAPNDVTASLWLLVRTGLLSDTRLFLCPSLASRLTGEVVGADSMQRLSNFPTAGALHYSYASPFSNAPGYRLDDLRMGGFALLADMSPGIDDVSGQDVTAPHPDDPPLKQALANSLNHRRAGQNVLYAEGNVEFRDSAYCGVNGDNIFTATASRPFAIGPIAPPPGPGVWGPNVGPAWHSDSYLVPTDNARTASAPLPRVTTRPATTAPTPATESTPPEPADYLPPPPLPQPPPVPQPPAVPQPPVAPPPSPSPEPLPATQPAPTTGEQAPR